MIMRMGRSRRTKYLVPTTSITSQLLEFGVAPSRSVQELWQWRSWRVSGKWHWATSMHISFLDAAASHSPLLVQLAMVLPGNIFATVEVRSWKHATVRPGITTSERGVFLVRPGQHFPGGSVSSVSASSSSHHWSQLISMSSFAELLSIEESVVDVATFVSIPRHFQAVSFVVWCLLKFLL